MPQHTVKTDPKEIDNYQKRLHLGRIICSLSVITVWAKVFGFAEKIVIAHFFGTSETADIYFAAMAVVLSLMFLIKELIYPAMLPVFTQTLEESPLLAGRLFGRVFLSAAACLALTACAGLAFPRILTSIIVPGFSDHQQKTMAHLLRLLAPVIIFTGLTLVTYTTLNARRKFLVSAFGDVIFKGIIAIGLIMLLPRIGLDALALVLGVGGLGCLLFHLCYLPERRYIIKPGAGASEPFKKMLLLMGPLVMGVLFSHLSGLVDNLLASTLPTGRLSYLNYAKKIIDAILLIGPVAIVTVIYSQVSHLAAQGKQEELTKLIGKSARVLLYVSVPITCLLITLRGPLLRCLFEHGQFDGLSTLGTSNVLLIYAFGLVTFSLDALFVYSFYALSDTKTPVKFGILCVFLDIILALILLPHFQEIGIAAALVISKTVKVLILANRLFYRLTGLWNIGIWVFLAKLSITTVIMGLVINKVTFQQTSDSILDTLLFELLLPATAGIFVYILTSFLLKIEECVTFLSIIFSKTRNVGIFITRS